jgi:alpha 1,6-mannosyltransferase
LKFDVIGDVVDLTGPRRFTKSVLKSLNLMLNGITADRNISLLLEPKLIGDVLVLPMYSFAASANTYDEVQGPVLLTHHYAGTWKNEYGGEQT